MQRTVAITGGSRGIGRALAEACLARGDRVVTCARAFPTPLAGAIEIAADLARGDDARRFIAEAWDRAGPIDVLVNSAALAGGELADVLAVNVAAAATCTRALLDRAPDARIVNVSSGVVLAPRAGAAAYIASKHALEGLTRALACDWPAATICAVRLGAVANIARDAVQPLLEAMTARHAHGRVFEERASTTSIATGDADLLAHPLGPSPAARAALARHAQHGALARYAPGEGRLADVIASQHGVARTSVTLGAGATDVIERALRAFAAGGGTLVANTPTWPLMPRLCRDHDVVVRAVPYRLHGGRVDHDLDALAAAIDRTVRMVYLVSPAYPMGCALDADAFARFLARTPDVPIVVDETYAEFVTRPDAARPIAMTSYDPRVLCVRSLSKFHGLAQLRVGYAVGAASERVGGPPLAISPLVQHAAIAALGDREHAARTLAVLARGRAAAPASALPSDAPFTLALAADVVRPALRERYYGGRYAMVPLWPTEGTATIEADETATETR